MPENVLVDLLRLEIADFDLVHYILFCVELGEPEVALRCFQAVIAFNRLDQGNVQTVALLTQVEFTHLTEETSADRQLLQQHLEESHLHGHCLLSLVLWKVRPQS